MILSLRSVHCQRCVETVATSRCRACGARVCPAHRWSTGNPRDGYYCVDRLCTPVENFESAQPDPHKSATGRYTALAFLAAIMVLVYFAKG